MLPNKLAVPLETFCQKEPARLLLRACTVSRLEVRLDPNAIQRQGQGSHIKTRQNCSNPIKNTVMMLTNVCMTTAMIARVKTIDVIKEGGFWPCTFVAWRLD